MNEFRETLVQILFIYIVFTVYSYSVSKLLCNSVVLLCGLQVFNKSCSNVVIMQVMYLVWIREELMFQVCVSEPHLPWCPEQPHHITQHSWRSSAKNTLRVCASARFWNLYVRAVKWFPSFLLSTDHTLVPEATRLQERNAQTEQQMLQRLGVCGYTSFIHCRICWTIYVGGINKCFHMQDLYKNILPWKNLFLVVFYHLESCVVRFI